MMEKLTECAQEIFNLRVPGNQTQREKILWMQQNRMHGTWVKCFQCQKWRYLRNIFDPVDVCDKWQCSMNQDSKFSSCEEPQSQFDENAVIKLKYTAGSLVWVNSNKYSRWPGMVDDDPEFSQFYWLGPSNAVENKARMYHVVFIHADYRKTTRQWFYEHELTTFTWYNSEAVPGKLLQESVRITKEALNMNVFQRLQKFSFARLYRGHIYSFGHAMRAYAVSQGEELDYESDCTLISCSDSEDEEYYESLKGGFFYKKKKAVINPYDYFERLKKEEMELKSLDSGSPKKNRIKRKGSINPNQNDLQRMKRSSSVGPNENVFQRRVSFGEAPPRNNDISPKLKTPRKGTSSASPRKNSSQRKSSLVPAKETKRKGSTGYSDYDDFNSRNQRPTSPFHRIDSKNRNKRASSVVSDRDFSPEHRRALSVAPDIKMKSRNRKASIDFCYIDSESRKRRASSVVCDTPTKSRKRRASSFERDFYDKARNKKKASSVLPDSKSKTNRASSVSRDIDSKSKIRRVSSAMPDVDLKSKNKRASSVVRDIDCKLKTKRASSVVHDVDSKLKTKRASSVVREVDSKSKNKRTSSLTRDDSKSKNKRASSVLRDVDSKSKNKKASSVMHNVDSKSKKKRGSSVVHDIDSKFKKRRASSLDRDVDSKSKKTNTSSVFQHIDFDSRKKQAFSASRGKLSENISRGRRASSVAPEDFLKSERKNKSARTVTHDDYLNKEYSESGRKKRKAALSAPDDYFKTKSQEISNNNHRSASLKSNPEKTSRKSSDFDGDYSGSNSRSRRARSMVGSYAENRRKASSSPIPSYKSSSRSRKDPLRNASDSKGDFSDNRRKRRAVSAVPFDYCKTDPRFKRSSSVAPANCSPTSSVRSAPLMGPEDYRKDRFGTASTSKRADPYALLPFNDHLSQKTSKSHLSEPNFYEFFPRMKNSSSTSSPHCQNRFEDDQNFLLSDSNNFPKDNTMSNASSSNLGRSQSNFKRSSSLSSLTSGNPSGRLLRSRTKSSEKNEAENNYDTNMNEELRRSMSNSLVIPNAPPISSSSLVPNRLPSNAPFYGHGLLRRTVYEVTTRRWQFTGRKGEYHDLMMGSQNRRPF